VLKVYSSFWCVVEDDASGLSLRAICYSKRCLSLIAEESLGE
jgi:hypothetical protein